MALNDTAIKALIPRAKRYDENDREGLVLTVHPSGRKVRVYRFRWGGKRQKLTIGPYPAISLKEARRRRQEAEELVHQSKDPRLERKRRKGTNEIQTMDGLGEAWIEKS